MSVVGTIRRRLRGKRKAPDEPPVVDEVKENDADSDVCGLCLEPMKNGLWWPCAHKLHTVCALDWVEEKQHIPDCPICRAAPNEDTARLFNDRSQIFRGRPLNFESILLRPRVEVAPARIRSQAVPHPVPSYHILHCCPRPRNLRFFRPRLLNDRRLIPVLETNGSWSHWCYICRMRANSADPMRNFPFRNLPAPIDYPTCPTHGHPSISIDLNSGESVYVCVNASDPRDVPMPLLCHETLKDVNGLDVPRMIREGGGDGDLFDLLAFV